MTLRRPFIAMALLVGFVVLDLAMSSWRLAAASPMSAFPALMFAAMSAASQRQPTAARMLSAFVAMIAAAIFLALKFIAP